VQLSPAARDWLADNGYKPEFGARPMARLVETAIKRPLAEAILFENVQEGGSVQVDVGPDGLTLSYAA
jgi:ATP-dependent Clp protease ATP-binding subunit ClpA